MGHTKDPKNLARGEIGCACGAVLVGAVRATRQNECNFAGLGEDKGLAKAGDGGARRARAAVVRARGMDGARVLREQGAGAIHIGRDTRTYARDGPACPACDEWRHGSRRRQQYSNFWS